MCTKSEVYPIEGHFIIIIYFLILEVAVVNTAKLYPFESVLNVLN